MNPPRLTPAALYVALAMLAAAWLLHTVQS